MKDHNKSRIRLGDHTTLNGCVAGRDAIQHIHEAPVEPKQEYQRGTVRFLPITERGLNITATLVTLGIFITGVQTARDMWDKLPRPGSPALNQADMAITWWFWFLIGLMVLWVPAMTLMWLVRRRTQTMSRFAFLPGLAGGQDGRGRGRLVLFRNTGECRQCGGKLRFYGAPRKWKFSTNAQTGEVRKAVAQRHIAAVCNRDPEHSSWLSPTDTDDLRVL